MRKTLLAACVLAATAFVYPSLVLADQSGLASMHAQRIDKGRLCFTEHTHVGSGTQQASKRAAIASAANDWSSFTAFEYGSDWASWQVATARQVACEPSAGMWTCEVHARPCLIGRRGSQHARR